MSYYGRPAPGAYVPRGRGPTEADLRSHMLGALRDGDGDREDAFGVVRAPSRRDGLVGPGYYDVMLDLDTWVAAERALGRFEWVVRDTGRTTADTLGTGGRPLQRVVSASLGAFALPQLPDVPYTLGAVGDLVLAKNNTSVAPGGAPQLGAPGSAYPQYPTAAVSPAGGFLQPWPFNPLGQLPTGQLTVGIEGLGSGHGFSGRRGRHYHADYRVTFDPLGDPRELRAEPSTGDWARVDFPEPVSTAAQLRLTFRGPDELITFDPDVYNLVAPTIDGNGFLVFTLAGMQLRAGDRIYIENPVADRPALSTACASLNQYIGRGEGHVVSGNPINPALAPGTIITDNFWTDPSINLTAAAALYSTPGADLTADLIASRVKVLVARRRMRIPLVLRCLTDEPTNGMPATAAAR